MTTSDDPFEIRGRLIPWPPGLEQDKQVWWWAQVHRDITEELTKVQQETVARERARLSEMLRPLRDLGVDVDKLIKRAEKYQ